MDMEKLKSFAERAQEIDEANDAHQKKLYQALSGRVGMHVAIVCSTIAALEAREHKIGLIANDLGAPGAALEVLHGPSDSLYRELLATVVALQTTQSCEDASQRVTEGIAMLNTVVPVLNDMREHNLRTLKAVHKLEWEASGAS